MKLKFKRNSNTEKGFTLVELIIVVAVIGILTAIAIPVYGSIQETSKKNAVEAAAENGYKAYLADYNSGKSNADSIAKIANTLNPPGSDILVHRSISLGQAENICIVAQWIGDVDEDHGPKYSTPIGKCGNKFYS